MVPTLLVAVLCGRAVAGPPKASPAPNLADAKLDDPPLRLCLEISAESRLVLPGIARGWVAPKCHAGGGTLEGVGALVFVADVTLPPGNALFGVLFAGATELPATKEGESEPDRVGRAKEEFVARLGDDLKAVGYPPLFEVGEIKLKSSQVTVGGKKLPASRTSVFNTKMRGASSKNTVLTWECVCFHIAGTETLVYLVLGGGRGGVSLDGVLVGLAVQRAVEVNKSGDFVKLIDVATGLPPHEVVDRHVLYRNAPGFVPNHGVQKAEDLEHAEDRLDASGAVTASCRIAMREPGAVETVEEEAALQMKVMEIEAPGAPRRVSLATKDAYAVLHTYATKLKDRECTATTAVFVLPREVWAFTWYTFGDAALVKADQAAFEKLLNKMQVAVRW